MQPKKNEYDKEHISRAVLCERQQGGIGPIMGRVTINGTVTQFSCKRSIAWNSETLRQDYGKDYMASVPKYDGFCTVPDHVGYKPVVGKFLNLYEPISHVPRQGDFLCIRSLVGHIFGEQYELGMDSLLQLLYFAPFRNLSWLKRHFICARILLKLACVMPK